MAIAKKDWDALVKRVENVEKGLVEVGGHMVPPIAPLPTGPAPNTEKGPSNA